MNRETRNPTHPPELRIKIGAWLLNPSLNRIERGEEAIHLEPKAAAVLELLAQRNGQPVTRQELLDQAWSDVIVSDDALTQVIIKLRKALGDRSKAPQYIQTIPKRGYRLLAPVEIIDTTPVYKGSKRKATAGYTLLLLFIIALGIYLTPALQTTNTKSSSSLAAIQNHPEQTSISVRPFEVMDARPVSETFALGITSDLITDLSKLSALRVILSPAFASEKAYSQYLVTGSVQTDSQRLKLYVHLVDTDTGHTIWSERYDNPQQSLFDMQQALSSEIVDQLSINVTATEKQRLAKQYTSNLQAYEYFLAGQAELLHREQGANEKAREQYRLALESDPAFARAYAGLALSYAADYRNQWVESGDASLNKAREMAVTARQIDPEIPEVYWVIGYVDTQFRKHAQALEVLQQGLELDPSYADAYALMGGINTYIGQSHSTLPLLREAMRLRPDAGFLYYLLLGRAYFFLDEYEQASINLNEALDRNPESLEAHLYVAATAVSTGDIDKAEWEKMEIESLEPGFHLSKWLETYPMTDSNQLAVLKQRLGQLGL